MENMEENGKKPKMRRAYVDVLVRFSEPEILLKKEKFIYSPHGNVQVRTSCLKSARPQDPL